MKNIATISSLAAIIFCLIIIVSCGTSRRGEPLNGPLPLSAEVENGRLIYMKNCNKCHPGGEGGVGPPINNVPLPGALIRFRVRSKAFFLGVGRMPSFKKHEISRDEMDDLVKYLKAVKRHDEKIYEALK